ncbi:MAG: spinster family MFS transporter [Candidatus Thorarchaeota archaeon]
MSEMEPIEEDNKEEIKNFKKDRAKTQVLINTANIIDNADGQLLPALYTPIQNDLGFSLGDLGGITAARSLLQAITTPLWGWLSDKYSRKIILAIGCFIWGIATIVMGVINNLVGFYFIRSFIGIGLAVIVPTSQSLIADYFHESKRGVAFGYLGLTGVLGAIFGTLYATIIGDMTILGIAGWRFSFITVGSLSIVLGILIWLFGKDPIRGTSEDEIGKLVNKSTEKKYSMKFKDIKKILTNKTFIVIVLQGVTGSIPWNSILFVIYWFEHIGFDSLLAGIAFSVIAIGAALGNLFGGFLGDWAAKKNANYGRILVAQISVFLGIPMMFIIFLAIPRVATTTNLVLFIVVGLITGFMISWCAPAANNPIFSELFEPEMRSTAYSIDRLFEGAIAASGTLIVAGLAVWAFGFQNPPEGGTIADLSPTVIASNIDAIAWAMIIATCIPWFLCMIFYTFAYFTYPKDRDNAKKVLLQRQQELMSQDTFGEENLEKDDETKSKKENT